MTVKRIAFISLSIVLLLSASVLVYAANTTRSISVTYRNIAIKVNNVLKQTDQEPFIYNNYTYVPLRFISEALNADVKWDDRTSTISISQTFSQEAVNALNEAQKQFGQQFSAIKLTEALYHNGALYFYISMESKNGSKENYYYHYDTKSFVLFLDVHGG